MCARDKWLMGIPFIAGFNLGLTALIAGRLWWFTSVWSDAAFVVALTAVWLAGMLLYPTVRGAPGQEAISRRLLGFGLMLSAGLSVYDRTHGPAAANPAVWSVVGLALFALAVLTGVMAARALGNAYSPDPAILPGQTLVTTGVYGYIQHPMYTAVLLVAAGLPLLLRSSWALLVALVIISPAVWIRIREEEALLADAFGESHRAYQSRTRRLIPFIF